MEGKTPVFHGEMELKAKGTAGGGEGDKGREEHVPWCTGDPSAVRISKVTHLSKL